jgi:ABC-type glycerol-3-phosphate transport system permease component
VSRTREPVNERPLRWKTLAEQVLIYVVLLVGVVLTAAPYVYATTSSFKHNAEIFSFPVHFLPQDFTLSGYVRLLSGESVPFIRQFVNSMIVSVGQTLLTLLLASMVGWGFAKYEFFGKRALFLLLLVTLTIPFQVTLVPLFLMMVKINWIDTYWAVILPGAVQAFGAFFMRQAMLSIPNELLDAARIDGASEWRIFWQIGLPLSRGALSVLAVLTFLVAWNDYLWPLIVLRSTEMFTYPIGLASLVGLYKVEYGMILAGAFLASLPVMVVFIAGRNQLLSNLTVGAVKG